MSSEPKVKPQKIARPGLFCHPYGEKGKIFEFPETVATSEGELDLPFFRCENCGAKWYDAADIVPLVLIYRLQLSGPDQRVTRHWFQLFVSSHAGSAAGCCEVEVAEDDEQQCSARGFASGGNR